MSHAQQRNNEAHSEEEHLNQLSGRPVQYNNAGKIGEGYASKDLKIFIQN